MDNLCLFPISDICPTASGQPSNLGIFLNISTKTRTEEHQPLLAKQGQLRRRVLEQYLVNNHLLITHAVQAWKESACPKERRKTQITVPAPC